MSLDKIYEDIPLSERICEGCGNGIERNAALIDGKLYHWGCFKKTKAQPTYRCLGCYSFLTKAGLNTVDFGDGTKPVLSCKNCGGTHLRKVAGWYREKYLQKES